MFAKTKMSYGVNEVLLASVLGSIVFSIFAAQPLTIVGVTGVYLCFGFVPTSLVWYACVSVRMLII